MTLPKLYTFSEDIDRLGTGAPRLVPARGGSAPSSTGGANLIGKNADRFSLYDVINDFNWTTSPRQGRIDMPEIRLKEKRLRTNAFIAQAAYYGYALQGTTADAIEGMKRFKQEFPIFGTAIDSVMGAFMVDKFGGRQIAEGSTAFASLIPSLRATTAVAPGLIEGVVRAGGQLLGGMIGAEGILSNINGIIGGAFSGLQNMGVNLNVDSLASKYLLAYEGLYLTEDTNFIYRFPYFVNNWNNISNSFSNTPMFNPKDIVGPLGDVYDMFSNTLPNAAITFSAYANMAAPGIYIEKPKFFDFSSDTGEAIAFNFPLINTGWSNYHDVTKNWQLLFMLMYQNRPNRRSRDLIDPPVIYEVSIPGTRYYPYAYIEEMKVAFLGSVRKMEIPVPYGNGMLYIQTQIPEAYDVTIRLRALTRESQNFLYSMLYDKYNVISVTNKRSSVDTSLLAGLGSRLGSLINVDQTGSAFAPFVDNNGTFLRDTLNQIAPVNKQ